MPFWTSRGIAVRNNLVTRRRWYPASRPGRYSPAKEPSVQTGYETGWAHRRCGKGTTYLLALLEIELRFLCRPFRRYAGPVINDYAYKLNVFVNVYTSYTFITK
jgi:hypothetical protein